MTTGEFHLGMTQTSDLLRRLAEAQRYVNARGWYGLDVLLNEAETEIRRLEQAKGGDADERSSNNARHATSPGVTAGASEIDAALYDLDGFSSCGDHLTEVPLVTRMRTICGNAAALIRRLVAERDNARAECAWLAKLLIRLREALNNIAEDAEDEGDRVYFGSTNDADWLKEIAREVESYAFDRIMRESKWPDYIESSAKANARATAAEAEVARLRAENAELKAWKKRRQEEDEDEADRREIW